MLNRYVDFNIELPEMRNVRVPKLQLPYHKVKEEKEKLLLVFDHVHASDYKAKKLLSGLIGNFLDMVNTESKKLCGISVYEYSVFAINLNYVIGKTTDAEGLDSTLESEGETQEILTDELNRKRVLDFYGRIKPTRVLTFGKKSFSIFSQYFKENYYLNANWTNLLGVPVDLVVGKNESKLIALLDPKWICSYQDTRDSYLIGFFIKNWANAMEGCIRFDAKVRSDKLKINYVTSIAKFEYMLNEITNAKIVSIDTETNNLNRIDNRIVLIQFATSKHVAYVLPLFHFQTPFDKEELEYVILKLRNYFLENSNDLHLYCNANFDIPVIRTNLRFPFYKTPIWDVQAGEFCFHPDTYVSTEAGSVKIRDLVEMPIPYRVWSMDLKTNKLELKKVTNRSRHKTTKRLVKVTYEGGAVTVTEDHKIWSRSRNMYVEAADLRLYDRVIICANFTLSTDGDCLVSNDIRLYEEGRLSIFEEESKYRIPVTVDLISVSFVESVNTVCDITVLDNHNLFVCNEINDHPVLAHNCLDENIGELASSTGNGYYNLGNLSIHYGFDGYITGKFGKEDRAGIAKSSLDTPGLLEYCGYDVCVLVGIYEQQLAQAKSIGHTKYENVVKHLIGDTIHTFSTMNINGVLVDKKYLWWLASAKSPIIGEVIAMESDILNSSHIKTAEKLIRKKNSIPQNGLFGTVVTSFFNLRKKEHLKTLFFDVLKLKPINFGADGTPSLDKEFQEEYAEVPIVKSYTALSKAKKMRDAFVKSLIVIIGKNEDAKKDNRIRPSFNFLRVVTGRTSANNPNLQQIPSRGKLSKYIKRVFIARPGTLFIKVDYSAHEVRGWSLVSGDKVLAAAFNKGIELYAKYVKAPTPENLLKFKEEGDIHIINSAYFFSVPVKDVTKDIRQSVKGVTFGLIYGRSAKSLAVQLGKTIDEVNGIIKKFFTRFKVAANWLLEIEKLARKNAFVEAPSGLRRHLWPYLLPNTKEQEKSYERVSAACDRRARNSPIQGLGSGIGYSAARYLETLVFNKFKKSSLRNGQLPIRNQNMVHDSMEYEVDYKFITVATEMIRESLTKGVQSKCEELYKMNFPVDLSIDMDIGATLDSTQHWDGSIQELHRILKETFTFQRDELKYSLDVEEELTKIFTGYLGEVLTNQVKTGFFTEAEKYQLDDGE